MSRKPRYARVTKEELPWLLQLWMSELRLQIWDIDADIVPRSKMVFPDTLGENTVQRELWNSLISLIDPTEDVDPSYDMEKTLVHELLHLYFTEFDGACENNKVLTDALEASIDRLATILVDKARKSKSFHRRQ